MSYANWLTLIRNAEKTSMVSGKVRKIHYTFPDGNEMAEEYSMETGVVLRRAWKRKRELMGEPQWELELGEPIKNPAESNNFVLRESSEQPVLTKRITKKNIEWRIRNLPYPIETYSVTANPDTNNITVRTSNKKYFKNIPIPELDRCGTKVNQGSISIHHQYNTLIITVSWNKLLKQLPLIKVHPNFSTRNLISFVKWRLRYYGSFRRWKQKLTWMIYWMICLENKFVSK